MRVDLILSSVALFCHEEPVLENAIVSYGAFSIPKDELAYTVQKLLALNVSVSVEGMGSLDRYVIRPTHF